MISETNFLLGPIMKAARKYKRYNQADVAHAIGCSQSALSKMEHNLLVPSAPQWFLFSRFTGIPPETLEKGVIDRNTKVRFNNNEISLGFKLPKKYRNNRGIKVKELYPLIFYAEKKIGEEAVKVFMGDLQIDPEFFLDFDNLINFELYSEFINLLQRNQLSSEEDIKEMIKSCHPIQMFWSFLENKELDLSSLLKIYVEQQNFFQVDFKVSFEIHGKKAMLVYSTEPYLAQGKSAPSKEVLSFLSMYRKTTLENLITKVLNVTPTITLPKEGYVEIVLP